MVIITNVGVWVRGHGIKTYEKVTNYATGVFGAKIMQQIATKECKDFKIALKLILVKLYKNKKQDKN